MGLGPGRVAFDLDLYEERVRSAPCFICAIVAGDPAVPTHPADRARPGAAGKGARYRSGGGYCAAGRDALVAQVSWRWGDLAWGVR